MPLSKNGIRLREAIRSAAQLLLRFMYACTFGRFANFGCTPSLSCGYLRTGA